MKVMKKMMMLVAACMLSLVGVAQTTESLKIADFEITAGKTTEVAVELTSDREYTAFQFDVLLPEGLSVALVEGGDEGEIDAYLDRSMATNSHSLTAGQVTSEGEGKLYRFISFSGSNAKFRKTSGTIVNIVIQADADAAGKQLAGLIKEIRFAENVLGEDGKAITTEYLLPEATFTVTCKEDPTTGINEITTGGAVKQIYTLDGKQVKTAQKGVNIVRQADGTVQKVRVK